MRFLVVGAGAIGGYVGGCLALAGEDVTVLARPTQAAALAAHGLRLTWATTGESKTAKRLRPCVSLEEALGQSAYDCLILTVKAYDVEAFAHEMAKATAAPPPVLALQNGVDSEAALAAVLGQQNVIAGTVTTAVSRQAGAVGEVPGVVVEKARGMGVARGNLRSGPLVEALNGAGLRARLYDRAGPMKWSKLLTNLVGNATSAILDMPVGELFADPRLYAVEAETLRECLRVMHGLGYRVVDLPGVPVRLLAWVISSLPAALARPLLQRAVGAGRGAKRPSLNLDVQAGHRRTEVRWLNGAVVAHGAALGIATPINRLLADTVEGLSEGRLERAAFRGKPEALLGLMGSQ